MKLTLVSFLAALKEFSQITGSACNIQLSVWLIASILVLQVTLTTVLPHTLTPSYIRPPVSYPGSHGVAERHRSTNSGDIGGGIEREKPRKKVNNLTCE